MYYSSKIKKNKFVFFTIKYVDKDTIYLQKWMFKNSHLKEDKCSRVIKKVEHLKNYLVLCFCESQLNIVVP